MTCKQACSLREVELGILEWPTVVPSQYGIERRAEAAAQKRKASSRVPKESTPIVGTQESVSTRPVRTRKPAKPRGAPPVPLTMPSGPPAAPSTVHAGASAAPLVPSLIEGQVYGVLLESLDKFVEAYEDLSLDGMSLANRHLALQGVRLREEKDLEYISSILEDRRLFIKKLSRRMQRRIVELGADTTEGEDSSEPVGGSEDEDQPESEAGGGEEA